MINEHDISDMYNLYELRRGDKFKLVPEEVTGESVKVPVAHEEVNFDMEYLFSHIDGMYSSCKDSRGAVHHFAAWTKVLKLTEQS
jgi:hypothetical protein